MISIKDSSSAQRAEHMPISPPNKIIWGTVGSAYSGIYERPLKAPLSNPLMIRISCVVTVSETLVLSQEWQAAEDVMREAFGASDGHIKITLLQAHYTYDPLTNFYKVRGNMDRLGTITPEGITAFENDGEVHGSLAVKVHINDDKVKLDLHIVNTDGTILARWEGVEVIDDTQVTWCFSDTGNIKISMEPILEPA